MIFKKKYLENKHIINLLYLVFYNSGVEFIYHLANDSITNCENFDEAKKTTCDILKYGILSNKIEVHVGRKIIYNKDNYKDLLKIVNNNFDKFIDIKDAEYPYNYGIYYTNQWIDELKKNNYYG